MTTRTASPSSREYDLFIVADGMGGHRAGDVASRLATDTIAEFFRSTAQEDVTWPFHFDTSLSEEENRLRHRHPRRQPPASSSAASARASAQGMGTTVVGALFSPQEEPAVRRARRRQPRVPRPQRRDPAAHARSLAASTTT
ncbi:MAG: protein phosphatase 2C domain-containing protein [Chitinophagaceae bacterium]